MVWGLFWSLLVSMINSWRFLVALATAVNKSALLLQRKHWATLTGQKFWGREPFPKFLHTVLVHDPEWLVVFFLGPCLATEPTSHSLFGFLRFLLLFHSFPLSCEPYQGLTLLSFGDVLTGCCCLGCRPQDCCISFHLSFFEVTAISQAMKSCSTGSSESWFCLLKHAHSKIMFFLAVENNCQILS